MECRADRQKRAGAAVRTAVSSGRALASACVGTLKPRLGNQWSAAWAEAGFPGGSLAIPRNPAALLQQLGVYYAGHPAHEVPSLTPAISCTAAACTAAAQAIAAANTASNDSNVAAGQAKAALDAALRAASQRLTALREELVPLLGAEDERWYFFGFERPADPETPEVPGNLVVTPGGPGRLIVDWDHARRAETYRITARHAATGDELAMQIVSDGYAVLDGLVTGTPVKIEVTARNEAGGESQPCPPATATVP